MTMTSANFIYGDANVIRSLKREEAAKWFWECTLQTLYMPYQKGTNTGPLPVAATFTRWRRIFLPTPSGAATMKQKRKMRPRLMCYHGALFL